MTLVPGRPARSLSTSCTLVLPVLHDPVVTLAHSRFIPPEECPVCGKAVPRNARACPECGADERTGWDDDATRYDGLDLPDPEAEEAMEQRRHQLSPTGIPVFWWLVGLGLTALLVYGALLAGFL